MTDEKPIPEGRLGRLMRIAGLGARTGASLLITKNGSSAAKDAGEVLGTMRGLAAKLGQMASYIDGLVPEEHQGAYEASLRALCAAAPRSPTAEIRRTVEEELKAPIATLFAAWSDEPFASASIGQVHRARLPDGRDVAVKVQHPGVFAAVEHDLANAGIFEQLFAPFGGRKVDSKGMLEEIRKRFIEELDYTLEAERQWQFSTLHQRDRTIRVPWVIDERSTKRVLTAEFVTGTPLEQAASEPEAIRSSYAETLWRFVFKGTLVAGKFNADPHPGNYIFHPDGRVTFLDFGCVQSITGARLDHARGMHFAALRRDERAFAAHATRLLETRGGRHEQLALRFARRCFEPLFTFPYRITRAYVASLTAEARAILREGRAMKPGEFAPLPAGVLFMNRMQFGFYSVLARLDVEMDYAAIERSFLRDSGITEAR
jgi:predicted unusual protein kinase regulating ubiquinone biosynthesis (AarF/ABC1/UbiB family)